MSFDNVMNGYSVNAEQGERMIAAALGQSFDPPAPYNNVMRHTSMTAEHGERLIEAIEHGGGGGASFEVVIVQQLPATGQNGKIYLVPNQGEEPDIYDEYLWIASASKFERIGSTKITFQTKTLTFVKDDGTEEYISFMVQPGV